MIQWSDDEFRIEVCDQQSRAFSADRLISAVRMILADFHLSSAEISIAVVDDATIRQLNRQYLDHDYETDVLSFVLEEKDDSVAGQLVVSTDTAARVAAELGVEMEHELALYVVHGTLHLMGLDDSEPMLAEEMRAAERKYLQRLGINHLWVDSGQ